MPGSSFGQAFRVTTAGESHGAGNVVIVDGCPPGLALAPEDLQADLARRRPGQSALVTQRQERDEPEILSGVFEGRTTGAPIAVLVRNDDARSHDYDEIRDLFRPGHADYTLQAKFGVRDHRGGGRSSARETVTRVAAGAIARKLLAQELGARVVGFVHQVGAIVADIPEPADVTHDQVERFPDGSPNPVRCPDPERAREMIALIDEVRRDLDSIGGAATIVATGVPAGLGEPVFDKLKADLAKGLMSIPAVLGVEIGAGFASARLRGSESNDAFSAEAEAEASGSAPSDAQPRVRTRTNRHGGVLGGVSSGMPIVLRAAVKPTSSLAREQATVDVHGAPAVIRTRGRHDPCLLPRFVSVGEAMVAIVLADHWLRWRGQCPELALGARGPRTP
jgi:chorismate synthase